jgi:hypothetical protein
MVRAERLQQLEHLRGLVFGQEIHLQIKVSAFIRVPVRTILAH